MLVLSRKKYIIKGISKNIFWRELDQITAGQFINPEFSHTMPYSPNLDNKFAGRKTNDRFSIYLYRPLINIFRTEILSKGMVFEQNEELLISCKYEIPFRSFLMFFVLGALFCTPFYAVSISVGLVFTCIGLAIYFYVVRSNHREIRAVVEQQFQEMEKKTNRI